MKKYFSLTLLLTALTAQVFAGGSISLLQSDLYADLGRDVAKTREAIRNLKPEEVKKHLQNLNQLAQLEARQLDFAAQQQSKSKESNNNNAESKLILTQEEQNKRRIELYNYQLEQAKKFQTLALEKRQSLLTAEQIKENARNKRNSHIIYATLGLAATTAFSFAAYEIDPYFLGATAVITGFLTSRELIGSYNQHTTMKNAHTIWEEQNNKMTAIDTELQNNDQYKIFDEDKALTAQKWLLDKEQEKKASLNELTKSQIELNKNKAAYVKQKMQNLTKKENL